jgi:septum formation protein
MNSGVLPAMASAFLWLSKYPLVLASASIYRRVLLEQAGIDVLAEAAQVDERALERELRQNDAGPAEVARSLALAKAVAVSALRPGSVVLGGDQTLALGDKAFHKPTGRAEAFETLRQLSGRTHHLHSGIALVRDRETLWSHVVQSSLTMRTLSDDMINRYLDATGTKIYTSAGGYQIEGLGIHLFRRVAGDHSAIMGLPLLPLLQALRDLGLVAR